MIEQLQAALGDRYRIERQVGEGGMATVFLATDVRHERQVALKVLRPELAATLGPDRFLQEVRVTANLQHPHILPLFDSGEAGGFLYYVMPYLEGESLRERVARAGELPVGEAVKILKEVTDALAKAHQMGVVHRDIKPDNVLLSGRHVVVTDFGVAKAVSEATGRHKLTTAGVALGTPAYMAPEQAAADEHIDHRADIYAVGAMGYELLTGRPPFSGRSPQAVLSAHVTEKPREVTELRAAVPPALGAVLMRCLEKKPADRWQSADELLTQLEAFATPTTGVTPTGMLPISAGGRRVPTWAKVGGAIAAVAMTAALWFTTRGGGGALGPTTAAADEPRRLVVVPLETLGSDPDGDVWAQLAAEWIARAIDEPRPVDVVPAAAVRDAVKTLGDTASVAAIADRLGARYAVAGTFARTGDNVRFEVEFLDVSTGERLRAMDPVTGPADSVEAVVTRLANGAATLAVVLLDPEAPTWISRQSVPPSIEAYRDHLSQGDLFCQGRYADAISMGDRVLARAPDFIPALSLNMTSYSNRGMDVETDSVHRILAGLRDEMTELERLSDDWMTGNVYGDPALATRAAEAGFRIAPTTYWGYSAGLTALRTRRLADALERFLAEDIDAPCNRDWRPWWSQTANTYHLLARYDDELALASRGLERFPDFATLVAIQGRAYAGMGRPEAADSIVDVLETMPPFGPTMNQVVLALELRAHGQEDAGDRLMARAVEEIEARSDDPYLAAQALFSAGRWADAERAFAALLEDDPENVAFQGFRGTALAELDRRDEALAVSADLAAADLPNLRGSHLGWRAEIAAALGDRDDAVQLLQEAFDNGFAYGPALHRDPALAGMRGYPPWEALVRPR